MRYFIIGLVFGCVLSVVPLHTPRSFLLIPLWYGSLQRINAIEYAPHVDISQSFALPIDNGYHLITTNGTVKKSILSNDTLIKPTVDGKYYIQYKKVGNEIALYDSNNEFFWKLPSSEYPYISPNGAIIVLLTADGSAVRIVDFNGNIFPLTELHSHFTTTVSFSHNGLFTGIGFIDGRFYIISHKGSIIMSGNSVPSTLVKGIAIDDLGNYAIIHCGNSKNDYIICATLKNKKSWNYTLPSVHHVKTSISVNPEGRAIFLDQESLLEIDIPGKDVYVHRIPRRKYGHSRINVDNSLFFITYPLAEGGSMWYIWQWGGGLLYSKRFTEEPFMDNVVLNTVILLRGNDRLFCFSYHQ